MSNSIDYTVAESTLAAALKVAGSGRALPVEWVSYTKSVFALPAMTWTPALATMLLAKASNERLDAMSLKVDPIASNSYSARGLCHRIIVPAASEYGFSIRNTGREPMNNQPFFRYSRIDQLERVRDPGDRDFFVGIARRVNDLSQEDALLALSAFLKVALEVAARARNVKVKPDGLTHDGVRIAAEDFLRADAKDRPQRLQAFAAACLDLVFADVKTRRLNDPSRDFPGDVQVLDGSAVTLAMEVRGKAVTQSELIGFAREVSVVGIYRAALFVDSKHQGRLDVAEALRSANIHDVHLSTFLSVAELLADALLWSKFSSEVAIKVFTEFLMERLREIEVSLASLEEWARAVAIAQGR